MRVLLLTNEYPPNIYGGAGVHVAHLCRELVRLPDWRHQLEVLHFNSKDATGMPPGVVSIPGSDPSISRLNHAKLLDALQRNLIMTGTAAKADLIHCHTWYAYLAGCLLKRIMQAPLVITVHSLEPHRPWKQEQLGEGYFATCWLEHIALANADRIIAVSSAIKQDIMDLYDITPQRIELIYNGIDNRRFCNVDRPDILKTYGIDPNRPYVLFVGRATLQKGILHLVKALPLLQKNTQVVLCAGAPDTPEIAVKMEKSVNEARRQTDNEIFWIEKMIPEDHLPSLYSHAAVFVCPSVYEPFGIINLEAMACGTPVVAAAVGGIPEVVLHGETGLLVPFEAIGNGDPEPAHPQKYAHDLAQAVNSLLASPQKRESMGRKAVQRVADHFGWDRIAGQTLACYEEILNNP